MGVFGFALLSTFVGIYLSYSRKEINSAFLFFPTEVKMQQPATNQAEAMLRQADVMIVGGGMAGLAAAFEVIKAGSRPLLVDKVQVSGNSAKATSGINAVDSSFQQIESQAVQLFMEDTLKSGQGLSKESLVRTLAARSGQAIDVLCNDHNLVLNDINVLGGHSAKRTHRFPAKDGRPVPVGWTIVSTLKKNYQQAVADGKAFLLEKTRVVDFDFDSKVHASGEQYRYVRSVTVEDVESKEQTVFENLKAVVLTAGGFSADSSPDSVLAMARPDLVGYPTTNGNFASGDMIKLALKKHLKTIHLDKVQLHPTGFVDPKSADAKTKFLCPEVVRGLGAILLNPKGARFTNELLRRDEVSEAIIANGGSCGTWGLPQSGSDDKQKISLLLASRKTAEAFGMAAWSFYVSKGLITHFATLEDLLKFSPSLDEQTVKETVEAYNRAARGDQADPQGSTVFASGEFGAFEDFYGAYITPSIHFCMGGIEIDSSARALSQDGTPILNMFVAGETAGGIHGANRLGGNGCLESLVFGQLAGQLSSTCETDRGEPKLVSWPKETASKFELPVLEVNEKSSEVVLALESVDAVVNPACKFLDCVIHSKRVSGHLTLVRKDEPLEFHRNDITPGVVTLNVPPTVVLKVREGMSVCVYVRVWGVCVCACVGVCTHLSMNAHT